MVKHSQGEGVSAFTCVSNRGCLVVGNCVVEVKDFDMIENFRFTTNV